MIQNFLSIIIKYGSTFLFVLMELVCFYLIISYNQTQTEIWANSSNIISGSFYEKYNNLRSFVNLREENNVLALENARLMRELASVRFEEQEVDSTIAAQFQFIPALVINNSINTLNNRITLNKGLNDGIKKGMGVITQEGIVGIVVYASDHFSTVNSLLNVQTKVSGLIKRTKTLGDLSWRGRNPEIVSMNSVPQYISVELGDSIITSGYSTMFPKGHPVGVVGNFKENPRTGYFDIDVQLAVDLASITQVYVITNTVYDEIEQFEKESLDE